MPTSAPTGQTLNTLKLGPFHLMPGITRVNGASYFLTAMIAVPMMAALSFLQPIVLRLVGVDRAVQGTLSGDLVFYQEIIVLLLTPFIGAMADKMGRRPLLMLGIALLGTSYALYPFADSVLMMYAYRTVFGAGLALVATTITVVNTDYVQDRSRGRWVALASMTQGIGIFITTQLLRRLPAEFAQSGYSEAEIARLLFWGCCGVCVAVFCIATFGLHRGKPAEARERDSIMMLVRSGMRAGMENGRIALGYATAFAARGDVLVVGTFSFLWTQQAAEDLGLGAVEGFRRGGIIVGIIQASALCWAMVMGWLLDKIDRVTGVIIGFTLAASGYMAFGLVEDPFSNAIFLPAVLLGMGETSTIITGNALIGQTAPAAIRGAVLGSFALCGATGILVCTLIGGRLFDLWMPGGPFVQMGIVNALVLTFAISVKLRATKQAP
ncbi:MAG: MFS transporter [Gammaproteobacteria bacterium]|jgi:MFS family permease